jgi:hypothetical protein
MEMEKEKDRKETGEIRPASMPEIRGYALSRAGLNEGGISTSRRRGSARLEAVGLGFKASTFSWNALAFPGIANFNLIALEPGDRRKREKVARAQAW